MIAVRALSDKVLPPTDTSRSLKSVTFLERALNAICSACTTSCATGSLRMSAGSLR